MICVNIINLISKRLLYSWENMFYEQPKARYYIAAYIHELLTPPIHPPHSTPTFSIPPTPEFEIDIKITRKGS